MICISLLNKKRKVCFSSLLKCLYCCFELTGRSSAFVEPVFKGFSR